MKTKLLSKFKGSKKTIIGMVHFPPNPGSPLYDNGGGIEKIFNSVYQDAKALTENGLEHVMFCNEGDRPYVTDVGYETPATMSAVISRVVAELGITEFGTDILWSPKAALAIGKATGASFVREVFTGIYAGDNGLWNTNAGEVLRYQKLINAENIITLFNINAEFASNLDSRPIDMIAKSVYFSSLADVLCVSGPMTGMETNLDNLKNIRETLGKDIPIFANTGVNIDNVQDILQIADGVVIGSHLKVDGNTWNQVDPERVKRFMDKVNQL